MQCGICPRHRSSGAPAALLQEAPPEPATAKRTPYLGKGREGATVEVGLGAGYTSEYASKNVRLSAMESISAGYFVTRDLAILLRFGASLTGRWSSGTYDDEGTIRRSHTSYLVDQLYLATMAYFFLIDRFIVAGGIGPTAVLRSVNTVVDETANGASGTSSHEWGIAGSFRFGVTVAYQGRNHWRATPLNRNSAVGRSTRLERDYRAHRRGTVVLAGMSPCHHGGASQFLFARLSTSTDNRAAVMASSR